MAFSLTRNRVLRWEYHPLESRQFPPIDLSKPERFERRHQDENTHAGPGHHPDKRTTVQEACHVPADSRPPKARQVHTRRTLQSPAIDANPRRFARNLLS
jgi:hypothetical protein